MPHRIAFIQGRLYVKLLGEQLYQLFYTQKDIPVEYDSFSKLVVAQAKNRWVIQPCIVTEIETDRGRDITPEGRSVTFIPAIDRALYVVFEKWDRAYSVKDWLEKWATIENICPPDRDRLKRISLRYRVGWR